jgi:hypothetical protein
MFDKKKINKNNLPQFCKKCIPSDLYRFLGNISVAGIIQYSPDVFGFGRRDRDDDEEKENDDKYELHKF